MGLLTDSVEAEFGGRHLNIRGTAGLVGGRFSLHVDGRNVDRRFVWWGRSTLQAMVDGSLVVAEVRVGLLGVRYRLFVGDEEVPLHVEPGTSSFSVELPPPLLAFARHQRRRLR